MQSVERYYFSACSSMCFWNESPIATLIVQGTVLSLIWSISDLSLPVNAQLEWSEPMELVVFGSLRE